MNAPPSIDRALPTEEDDIANLNPKFPKIAAGFALLSGSCAILNAIQILTTVRIRSATWAVAPYVLLALGAALVFFARGVFVTRPWAAIAGVIDGALLAMASGAWLIFAVSNGFLALYAIWTPMGAIAALCLCAGALPACQRAQRARDRLAAQGMGLGL